MSAPPGRLTKAYEKSSACVTVSGVQLSKSHSTLAQSHVLKTHLLVYNTGEEVWGLKGCPSKIHLATILHAHNSPAYHRRFLKHLLGSEKAMAPHSSTLAWEIPWTEEPGGLQSLGLLRVGHD